MPYSRSASASRQILDPPIDRCTDYPVSDDPGLDMAPAILEKEPHENPPERLSTVGEGPGGHFTGHVRIDPLIQAVEPARVAGALVTFEPGARTAWHTHPLGQTLIVMSGLGWAQREGGPIEEIRPGDVVWFSPGEKHWHGATATNGMSHIAVQEALDGKVVEWLEQVSDEQYRK